MKISVNIIILCISIGCSHLESNSTIQFETYKDYYQIINEAELAIIEGDYIKSYNLYKKGFNVIPNPFLNDQYNAAIVAIKSEQNEAAIELVKNVLKKNIPLSVFEKPIFENLLETQKDAIGKYQPISINQFLSDSLYAMQALDQMYRPLYDSYGEEIAKLDAINRISLELILIQHGYPNEFMIKPVSLNSFPQDIVILHAFQEKDSSLNQYLLNSVYEGKLHPKKYTFFRDQLAEDFVGEFGALVFYKSDTSIQKEYNASLEAIINKKRIGLGLETLAEYNKKALFMQFYNKDGFLLHVYNSRWILEYIPEG